MKASDVYTIAKALSKKEQLRLYDMLRCDMNVNEVKDKSGRYPDFTRNDALIYLLKNVVK